LRGSWAANEVEGDLGMMGTVFVELRQGPPGFEGGRDQGEQGVAQQGKGADDVGVAAAGPIFSAAGVAPPMVAVFHAPPMAPDQFEPLRGGAFGGLEAADEVADFGSGGALSAHDGGVDAQDRPREREVGPQRFYGGEEDAPALLAAVVFFVEGQKGGALARMERAVWRRPGWLALTCSR